MTARLVAARARLNGSEFETILDHARDSFLGQAYALRQMADRMNGEFSRAANLVLSCTGRVVVSGIGKSGLIGKKIVATLACSGTPSAFLHPGEAFHGDLGMVTRDDVLVLISNSGETEEVVRMLPHFHELGCPIIAILGRTESSLARSANAVLDVSVERESCPHNLVPTTSTLATLAMGDALAMAVMQMRNFSSLDFARFHPGGSLGGRLNNALKDVMRTGNLPLATRKELVREALYTMSAGRSGLVIVVDDQKRPVGIVTDGDVRRAVRRNPNILELQVEAIMTSHPVVIRDDATLQQAEARMSRLRINALVVVDRDERVVGLAEVFGQA